jgi:cation diffusion facilitator CzcD-associated flavoprotein CzcO
VRGSVAVIGAGVAGLCAARYLLAQGVDVSVLESHHGLGGQWDWQNPRSGVWAGMRTNTASVVTKPSDVRYPDGTALYPHNRQVLALLEAYADRFGLRSRIRFGAEVTHLAAAPDGGYRLTWREADRSTSTHVDRVVVATGRFTHPRTPTVPGLDAFAGPGGVRHAFDYEGPARYAGLRVLVGGSNISSLEIASELAMGGAARVTLAQRRPRWVLPKVVAGTPIEYLVHTRGRALAAETIPAAAQAVATRELILRIAGDPARYGAPAPDPDPARAGVTLSQHYLSLVAERRIDVRPWLVAVDGRTVTFTDGTSAEVDAVVLGTGFDLHLPFLDADLRSTLRCAPTGLVLSDFTVHPDLPGLAFLGLWAQRGAYPVVLEQQARYLAYSWGGAVAAPSEDDLRRGLRECVDLDHHGGYRQQNEMAIRFARLAGVDPGSVADPALQHVLAASATTGESFRIVGPDALPDAAATVAADLARYGPLDVLASLGPQAAGP